MGNINVEWKAEKYTQSGFDFGEYAHNIWKPPTAAKVTFEKISEVIRFFNMRKEVILGSLFKKQMGS